MENDVQKRKILIVDDEPANIKVLAEVLESVYKIVVATNGTDALECAKSEEKPDLILLDIIMPSIDGYEVLKELKADIKTQNIPVIFLTGMNEETDEAHGLLLGAVDYITKPFSLATVNARVRTHIELKRHRDNLEELVYERTEELAKSNKRLRREIQDRKNAEENLRLQTSALEAAAVSVLITDKDGTILWINNAFTEMTGYTPDEIIGETPSILKSGKQSESYYDNLWSEISAGNTWQGELINRRKDGAFYTEDMTITPFRTSGDQITHYIAIKHDVSNRQQLENHSRQNRHIEYTGSILGGMSLDLVNIFFPVKETIQKAIQNVNKNDRSLPYLTQLDKMTKRVSELTRQILTFSRQANQKLEEVNLLSTLDEAIDELQESLPPTIRIEKNFNQDHGTILGDAHQIKKAIKNIGAFACKTMIEKQGELKIDMLREKIGPENAETFPELEHGEYNRIRFTDTGRGMDQTEISKLFDPFLSSESQAASNSLHSVVHDAILAHEGTIRVLSDPGQGTVYDILFPIHVTEDIPRISESEQSSIRILFVDDEEPITQICKIKLERLNYNVTPMTSSHEALELFRKAPEDFDVVITDLIMPEITGIQLADALFKIRTDIPVILCSGFSEMITREHAEAAGFIDYLKKPLIYRKIDRSIRNAIKLKSRKK